MNKRFIIQRIGDGRFLTLESGNPFWTVDKMGSSFWFEVGKAVTVAKFQSVECDVVDEDGTPYYMHRL